MASYTLSFIPLTLSNPRISVSRHNGSSSSASSVPPTSSLLGKKLLVAQSSRRCFVQKHRCLTSASTVLNVPTSQPENGSSDKLPKWSARAIKSLAMGELEARKLKYPSTGTEAILMGILVEVSGNHYVALDSYALPLLKARNIVYNNAGTSTAAKFLRGNGVTLFQVRDETISILGKSDMYFFSPEHPPLTEPAQKAIAWAIDEKTKSGVDGELTTAYLLLGIWSQKDSAGCQILEKLGFSEDKVKEVEKSMNEDVDLSFKKQSQ